MLNYGNGSKALDSTIEKIEKSNNMVDIANGEAYNLSIREPSLLARVLNEDFCLDVRETFQGFCFANTRNKAQFNACAHKQYLTNKWVLEQYRTDSPASYKLEVRASSKGISVVDLYYSRRCLLNGRSIKREFVEDNDKKLRHLAAKQTAYKINKSMQTIMQYLVKEKQLCLKDVSKILQGIANGPCYRLGLIFLESVGLIRKFESFTYSRNVFATLYTITREGQSIYANAN